MGFATIQAQNQTMGSATTQAQNQTKLRSGIQPMQIIINTNYLAKRPIPLTSDLFEFPYLTAKPSGLEKYPLISTNVKYDAARMTRLTHPERVQIFFNFSSLIQFVSELTIEEPDSMNDVLKHNTKFMLEMLFPMTFPVIKKLKVASNPEFAMSIFYAAEKKVAYHKYNSYLKLEGKMCTVDEIRFMDTFDTNPVYVKLYDLAKDFLTKRNVAIPVLRDDIQKRFGEFNDKLEDRKKSVLNYIVEELNSLSGMSTSDRLDLEKLNDELAAENAELKDVKSEIVIYGKYEKLFQAKEELLNFRNTGNAIDSIQKVIKEMTQYLNNFSSSFPSFSLNASYKANNLTEIQNQKRILDAIKPSKNLTLTKNTLIRGFDSLIKYLNELQTLSMSIEDADKLDISKLDKTETELETKIADLNDKLKKLNSKKKISPAFIGDTTSSANFTNTNVLKALLETTTDYKSKIKGLNSKLKQLVDEYELIYDRLTKMHESIETSLTDLNSAISDAKSNSQNIDPATIKNMKDAIKPVYETDISYFSQRTPLAETFMKLRKICGFGYIITTMHQYQDNQLISNEYNLNYNVDADLKKGEYLFHKEIVESMRLYYYPNRQSMDPDIKTMIRVQDSAEIDMDKIVEMFEESRKGKNIQSAAIDLVDLQGKPRYECQVQMVVVGGIITEENSSLIDCSYTDYTTGSNILKEKYNLNIAQFTDLTQQIADVEKNNKIKYEKQKFDNIMVSDGQSGTNTSVGPIITSSNVANSQNIVLPPPPPPKQTSTTVSDNDLESFISRNPPNNTIPASQLKDLVKKPEYAKVKDFIETAVNYEKSPPDMNSFMNSTDKTTHRQNYSNKKIDADGIIDGTLKKKNNELEENNKNLTLTPENKTALEREVATLTALKTTIDSIDANLKKQLNLKGGKKTRKRWQKRGKKTRRRQLRYRH